MFYPILIHSRSFRTAPGELRRPRLYFTAPEALDELRPPVRPSIMNAAWRSRPRVLVCSMMAASGQLPDGWARTCLGVQLWCIRPQRSRRRKRQQDGEALLRGRFGLETVLGVVEQFRDASRTPWSGCSRDQRLAWPTRERSRAGQAAGLFRLASSTRSDRSVHSSALRPLRSHAETLRSKRDSEQALTEIRAVGVHLERRLDQLDRRW